MVRYCDGNDPYLRKQVPGDGGEMIWVPCDCGRRFDDVKYLTVYPHSPVGGAHYGTSFHGLLRRGEKS